MTRADSLASAKSVHLDTVHPTVRTWETHYVICHGGRMFFIGHIPANAATYRKLRGDITSLRLWRWNCWVASTVVHTLQASILTKDNEPFHCRRKRRRRRCTKWRRWRWTISFTTWKIITSQPRSILCHQQESTRLKPTTKRQQATSRAAQGSYHEWTGHSCHTGKVGRHKSWWLGRGFLDGRTDWQEDPDRSNRQRPHHSTKINPTSIKQRMPWNRSTTFHTCPGWKIGKIARQGTAKKILKGRLVHLKLTLREKKTENKGKATSNSRWRDSRAVAVATIPRHQDKTGGICLQGRGGTNLANDPAIWFYLLLIQQKYKELSTW